MPYGGLNAGSLLGGVMQGLEMRRKEALDLQQKKDLLKLEQDKLKLLEREQTLKSSSEEAQRELSERLKQLELNQPKYFQETLDTGSEEVRGITEQIPGQEPTFRETKREKKSLSPWEALQGQLKEEENKAKNAEKVASAFKDEVEAITKSLNSLANFTGKTELMSALMAARDARSSGELDLAKKNVFDLVGKVSFSDAATKEVYDNLIKRMNTVFGFKKNIVEPTPTGGTPAPKWRRK